MNRKNLVVLWLYRVFFRFWRYGAATMQPLVALSCLPRAQVNEIASAVQTHQSFATTVSYNP